MIYEVDVAIKFINLADDIKYKFNGSFLIGGQYHFTMETQTCFCVPTEDGIDVYPSSQWLNCIQVNVSAALAIPLNWLVIFCLFVPKYSFLLKKKNYWTCAYFLV